ncbi:MAG: SpoIID/LytB domain-containing protein [Candidatus Azobacteroides sp.]|nr:SpoIID/LytB domain-containing protein [Candidatus Azobacteroides sp.]
MIQPQINIGILASSIIEFRLNGVYKLHEDDILCEGEYIITLQNGRILFDKKLYSSLSFTPLHDETASFNLKNVSIGIQFHWERVEEQTFKGSLRFIPEKENVRAINILPVEDYLESVISSEMNATSSLQLLKAHAVVSRSWLLAQLNKKNELGNEHKSYESSIVADDRIIRWYDREDHVDFDVCADDHCQRYQGITKISTPVVKKAIGETFGEVLMSENKICDARFSKCCGGMTEEFENCWEPKHYSYLSSVPCHEKMPELTSFENWILSSPPAFCNTQDKEILFQILNDYDRETNDFYRWTVKYTQQELSNLIAQKTGIDFGEIIDLIPEERGKSGRIVRLLIGGTKKQIHIGKELEIRKILSKSHLYSSAFVVEKNDIAGGIPQSFTLHGAGWGHGVGLCQIGAAVMASKNYSYQEILNHYFQGASIEKIYTK